MHLKRMVRRLLRDLEKADTDVRRGPRMRRPVYRRPEGGRPVR